jgi:predicted molibdopterin-dependent oxidoreductase YjgC
LDGVLMNPDTAQKRGIGDGDEISIETQRGYKTKAIAILSERIHPEVIATLQHKIRRGAELNEMIRLDDELLGFVNASVDTCLLARVSKANPLPTEAR